MASTLSYVEDIMADAIKGCSFEHPCLSYILDLVDPLWDNVFTSPEREEIKIHNSPQMPIIDRDIKSHIDSFDQGTFLTAEDFFNHAISYKNQSKFGQDHLKRWIEQSIINAAELFEFSDELMIDDYSEADLSSHIWQFIYRAFRTGNVKVKLGERSSTSSALAKNERRSFESRKRRERKIVGSKVDMLFKCGRYEVGCSEVGKDDVLSVDDKYLDDGISKLPKTLRDMLCQLVKINPVMINKLYTVGFLMMGLDLELLTVDVPEGIAVSRVTRSKKLTFPVRGSSLGLDFLPLLEITLLGRGLMMNVVEIVERRKRKAVEFNGDDNQSDSYFLLPHSTHFKSL